MSEYLKSHNCSVDKVLKKIDHTLIKSLSSNKKRTKAQLQSKKKKKIGS